MTHEYGRHNTNNIGCRNICIFNRQLSVEILYGLQGNYGSDEKMISFIKVLDLKLLKGDEK
mgnify:CR=1 FL=1|tara:strand:- start:806 stop:988 length:183 start_codon:yes stop_codon:yes gene_type:complete